MGMERGTAARLSIQPTASTDLQNRTTRALCISDAVRTTDVQALGAARLQPDVTMMVMLSHHTGICRQAPCLASD